MDEVGKREFLHYTEKYIKEGDFVLTKHKKPEWLVSIRRYTEKLFKQKRRVE